MKVRCNPPVRIDLDPRSSNLAEPWLMNPRPPQTSVVLVRLQDSKP